MSFLVALALLTSFEQARAPGSVRGEGAVLVLDHRENATFTAISFLLDRRETVSWASDGAVIVDSAYSSGNTARARNFAEEFGLTVVATDTPPAPAWELRRVRAGVLLPDCVQPLLHEFKVPFTTVEDRLKLRQRFDSLVLCGPVADAPSLSDFVREGGTLIAIGPGAEFAIRALSLDVIASPGTPGPAHFDATHPVAFGMPAVTDLSARRPLVFATKARHIAAALVDYPLGRGRILLFGFEPQSPATLRLLLNSLYWASAQRLWAARFPPTANKLSRDAAPAVSAPADAQSAHAASTDRDSKP